MLDGGLPNLTFPEMTYGEQETPWDLRPLLYKGGAGTNVRTVDAKIEAGHLGHPLVGRIELVLRIHDVLANFLGRGGRRVTVSVQIQKIRLLFHWSDEHDFNLNLISVQQCYLDWTDSLVHRVQTGAGLSSQTAYDSGSVVGWVLDRVLGRSSPIIKTTRLHVIKRGSRALSPKADKQNLEETFALGHFLLDISDALSVDAIWGPLPVRIQVRNGNDLEEWSKLKRPEEIKPPNPKFPYQAKYLAKQAALKRAAWEADSTVRTRYPLINLRIQAEMFMLMGQPAINLAQVHQIRMDQWRYKPSTHGFEVRAYKHRRWGPVEFEIYSAYRPIFERYLRWRAAMFPDDPDGLLFPLIGPNGRQTIRHPESPPVFSRLINCCERAGIKYVSPRALRNTNVNWTLRRTQDPDLTAEEKQHHTKTLLRVYEKPSQQRAMVQIKAFWAKHDPAQAAAGPGSCVGKTPEPIKDIPAIATKPDCLTPSGCLFCTHQRDIDSLDHVWSLVTYRLLKSFELKTEGKTASKKAPPQHPAEVVIDRLTSKLNFIQSSSPRRESWLKEALLRIEEGRYHPTWAQMIEST